MHFNFSADFTSKSKPSSVEEHSRFESLEVCTIMFLLRIEKMNAAELANEALIANLFCWSVKIHIKEAHFYTRIKHSFAYYETKSLALLSFSNVEGNF